MKRILWFVVFALVVAGLVFGAGSREARPRQKSVAFLINTTTSQYSGAYYNVFREYIANYPDIQFTIYDGQERPTLQAQQMDEAIANEVDLIILWPQDSRALVASARRAKEAGIPVLVANNPLDPTGDQFIVGYLSPDYYAQGQLAADAMHLALPNGGTYVHLGSDPSYEAARLRLAGFQDRNNEAGYGLRMLGEPAMANWRLELGKSLMVGFLTRFQGQIDAVYAVDDTVGNGALQAIQEDRSGQNDGIKIVSIGGIQDVLSAIQSTENYFSTIYQSPTYEAPATIELAIRILNGEQVPFSNSMDNPIITKENVTQFGPAY